MPTKLPKPKKPKLNLKKLSLNAEPFRTASAEREGCARCGLFKKSPAPFGYPIIPEGWSGKLALICAPMSRLAAKLFYKMAEASRYEPSDVALIPIVRCRSASKPNIHQIRCCRPYLLHALRKLAPANVLGLGSESLKALRNNGDGNVTKARGKEITI